MNIVTIPVSRLLNRYSFAVFLMCMSFTAQAGVADALNRPALLTGLGPQSFLVGIDQAKDRVIAVGERGVILLSDDSGQNWKQAASPVSVTLTAVRFADSRNGFAIGHGGTVLGTEDGGNSWQARLDGMQIASLILKSAEARGDERQIMSAQRLVADGPDKPLLDVLVLDSKRLIVTGAYGILLYSDDAGQSWESWGHRIDNPGAMHLYAISKKDERVLIAGEMGMAWLSLDGGNSFSALPTPYEGSYFTAELSGADEVVLAGLRGNIWRSQDNGQNWSQLQNPVPATINASTRDQNGNLLLATHAGMILRLNEDSVEPVTMKSLPPINNILQTKDEKLIVLTMRGAMIIDLGAMK